MTYFWHFIQEIKHFMNNKEEIGIQDSHGSSPCKALWLKLRARGIVGLK